MQPGSYSVKINYCDTAPVTANYSTSCRLNGVRERLPCIALLDDTDVAGRPYLDTYLHICVTCIYIINKYTRLEYI